MRRRTSQKEAIDQQQQQQIGNNIDSNNKQSNSSNGRRTSSRSPSRQLSQQGSVGKAAAAGDRGGARDQRRQSTAVAKRTTTASPVTANNIGHHQPKEIRSRNNNSSQPAIVTDELATGDEGQHHGERQQQFNNIRRYSSRQSSSTSLGCPSALPVSAANVGCTVAALRAAVLATAPTAVHHHHHHHHQGRLQQQQQQQKSHLLAVPGSAATTDGGGGGVIAAGGCSRSACSSPLLLPSRPSPYSSSLSPAPSSAQSCFATAATTTAPSPLHSLRREFKHFKRRSISEISLVLELIRGAASGYFGEEFNDDYEDEEGIRPRSKARQRPRFHTASPVDQPGTSAAANNDICRGSPFQSTGNSLHRKSTRRRVGTEGAAAGGLRPVGKIQWERLSPAAIQRQLLQVQEEKAMLQAPTAPIDASKFVAYVQERRKKRILFKGEYLMVQRSVDSQRCTTEVAIRMGEKNQYSDTLPYDHNRVVLELRPVDDSHYINASYVNSWLNERAYVVTQSVRSKQGSNELWRCVWELGANTIVMLTKIFDFMRVVCLQYWPQTQFQFGEIHVETLEVRTYAHFVIRTFRLRKNGGIGDIKGESAADGAEPTERIVKHFHFTEWELNSFPYISAFVELRRRVRQWTDKNLVDAPIVVHCSNGGGRSGTFLAVDANLELMQRTGQLDIYGYGRVLANSRQHLVDSVEQYMFIYDVLCEAVLCNIQPIAMHQLKDRSTMYKARKDREFMELQDSHENKLLMMLTAPLRIGDCAGGHRLENRGKNRDVMVVPPDHARPYLQTLHGESKDYTYINAVEVDGFTRKGEFIVTEWPKQQTLDSFWTLIFDHNVHTVISLTNQPTDTKQYPQFVHNKGKRNYGPFTVEIVNYQQYPGLCSHMLKISKRPTSAPIPHTPINPDKGANKKLTFMISEIMATGASQQQLETDVRLCCIIQVKMWPMENKVPLSTTALIEVLKMTRSWRQRAPDRPEQRPTIVMSHNGVSRCGIFIAANVCIDQMEMDHEVDVFHAVKLIRINRPQLIDMKDEYKYLYDLMLHWYMTNPELRAHEPAEAASLDSEEYSEAEDEILGTGTGGFSSRSRSGSQRRSIQRSKSSKASRRTQKTVTTLSPPPAMAAAGDGTKLSRNSSSVSAARRSREPVYLN